MKLSFASSGSRRKATMAGITAIALAAALAACSTGGGSTAEPTAGEDCEVFALQVVNVTGAGSQNGASASAGAQAAVDYVNENGGVNGCTLTLDVADDTSDYTKNLPLLQAALAEKDYAMVLGADFGAASMVPYLARQGQFGIFANGTKGLFDPKITPNLFDSVVPSADVAKLLAAYAVDQGAKKIAVAVDTSTVGATVLDAITAAAAASGGEVIASEKIDLSSVNMTPVIQRLQASGADTLIFNIFGAASGYFVRDLRASDWKVDVYGSSSVQATNLAALVPVEDVKGIVLAGPAVNTIPSVTPGLDNLIKQLKDNKVTIGAPMSLFAQSHDAIISFAAAANGAKSVEAADLTKWLEENGDTTIDGLAYSTTTSYSSTNHEWHPKDGIAFGEAGELKDGQYQSKRLSLVNG